MCGHSLGLISPKAGKMSEYSLGTEQFRDGAVLVQFRDGAVFVTFWQKKKMPSVVDILRKILYNKNRGKTS